MRRRRRRSETLSRWRCQLVRARLSARLSAARAALSAGRATGRVARETAAALRTQYAHTQHAAAAAAALALASHAKQTNKTLSSRTRGARLTRDSITCNLAHSHLASRVRRRRARCAPTARAHATQCRPMSLSSSLSALLLLSLPAVAPTQTTATRLARSLFAEGSNLLNISIRAPRRSYSARAHRCAHGHKGTKRRNGAARKCVSLSRKLD